MKVKEESEKTGLKFKIQKTKITASPQFPASEIKQTFLSTNLASVMSFERRAAGLHFQLQQSDVDVSSQLHTQSLEPELTSHWTSKTSLSIWSWKWKWSHSVMSDSLWPHGL